MQLKYRTGSLIWNPRKRSIEIQYWISYPKILKDQKSGMKKYPKSTRKLCALKFRTRPPPPPMQLTDQSNLPGVFMGFWTLIFPVKFFSLTSAFKLLTLFPCHFSSLLYWHMHHVTGSRDVSSKHPNSVIKAISLPWLHTTWQWEFVSYNLKFKFLLETLQQNH